MSYVNLLIIEMVSVERQHILSSETAQQNGFISQMVSPQEVVSHSSLYKYHII